jgi:hypothetical protein
MKAKDKEQKKIGIFYGHFDHVVISGVLKDFVIQPK